MHSFWRGSHAFNIRLLTLIGCFLLANGALQPVPCYADNAARKSPQVEYIAPDGQFSSLRTTNAAAHQSSVAFIDRDTISCTLREGETTFIIELPKNSSS